MNICNQLQEGEEFLSSIVTFVSENAYFCYKETGNNSLKRLLSNMKNNCNIACTLFSLSWCSTGVLFFNIYIYW